MPADLLTAVRAAPDDDLPRLLYADALDEAGDADRAEFIRVQCELARLPDWDPRRPALEDREHDLLDRHEPVWLGDLADFDEWEWRRGFVDEVTGSAAHLRGIGDTGYAGHPVRSAHFTTWRAPPNRPGGWAAGNWMRPLRRLSLAGAEVNGAMLRRLVQADQLAGLQALDVSQNPVLGELPDILAAAAFAGNLRELTAGGRLRGGLSTGPADALDADRLAQVLAGGPLERLHLPDVGLTADGLRHLRAAGRNLRGLDVSANDLGRHAAVAFAASGFDQLARLDVSGTNLGRFGLDQLLDGRLPALTELEVNSGAGHLWRSEAVAGSDFWRRAGVLRMHSCELTPDLLAPLCAAAGPPALRLLDLADNRLGDRGVGEVSAAPWADAVTWLALSRNALTDAAAGHIAGGGRLHSLRVLHLAFTDITAAGAAALAGAPSLARLRLLTVSHTPITDRSVPVLLDAPHWRLSGLGLAGCDLSVDAVHALARSPRLRRLQWLDLSGNPRLGGDALLPLAESPHLGRLCELDVGGTDPSDRVRDALGGRLGRRLSD